MQDAAAQRRIQQELVRQQKLDVLKAKELQIQEEMERKAQLKTQQELIKKQKREQIQQNQMAKALEKKRQQADMIAKLELGKQRKIEQLRHVREKAALANQNAKIVAERIRHNRETGDDAGFLSPRLDSSQLPEMKSSSSKLKKVKQKITALSHGYVYTGTQYRMDAQRKSIRDMIRELNKTMFRICESEAGSDPVKSFNQGCQQIMNQLEQTESMEDEVAFLYQELLVSKFPERTLTALMNCEEELLDKHGYRTLISLFMPAIDILSKIFSCGVFNEYVCCNEAAIMTKILDLLGILIPNCTPKSNQSLWTFTSKLFCMLRSAIDNANAESNAQTCQIINQVFRYASYRNIFNDLCNTFCIVYGTLEELGAYVEFLLDTARFLESCLSFGSKKYCYIIRYFENPIFKMQKLPANVTFVQSHFIESNVMGLMTLLSTCLLSGGSYKTAGQQEVPNGWKELSNLVFRIINKLCHIDVRKLQEGLNVPTELLHLCLFWMQYTAVHPQAEILDQLVENIVFLVGNVVKTNKISFQNPRNTEMMQIGLPGQSLLQRLVNLPFKYFNCDAGRSILFPTLAILAMDEKNRMVIEEDLSLDFLSIYFKRNPNCVDDELRNQITMI